MKSRFMEKISFKDLKLGDKLYYKDANSSYLLYLTTVIKMEFSGEDIIFTYKYDDLSIIDTVKIDKSHFEDELIEKGNNKYYTTNFQQYCQWNIDIFNNSAEYHNKKEKEALQKVKEWKENMYKFNLRNKENEIVKMIILCMNH